MNSGDIVVIGSCMIDLICYAPRLPKPGETLHGTSFQIGHGGKGANQCVAASKLEAKTALVAKLGDDDFGRKYKSALEKFNINVNCLRLVNDYSSGMAQITVANNGENQIVIVPGANSTLSIADIDSAVDLIKHSKVVLFQFETPLETTLYGLELVKKFNGFSVLNAAPAIKDVDPKIFRLVNLLCINETEAEILAGKAVVKVEDALTTIKMLLKLGCDSVILTLGEKGAVYISKSDPEPIHVNSRKVENVIDTTGAGDAFLGTLAYYLAYHSALSMKETISRCCIISSYSVIKSGTQTSFPEKKDLPVDLFS